jgi:hypothetical protein
MNPQQLVFEVRSGKMRVTDPCYDKGTWCSSTVPVKPGRWIATLETSDQHSWGVRVARLIAHHESIKPHVSTLVPHITIGVDSGQAGFFDDAAYPDDEPGEYGELDTFYGRACAATSSETQAGGIVNWDGYDMGVCSSSGFGDGSYALYGSKQGDVYVALMIDFIPEEEEASEAL